MISSKFRNMAAAAVASVVLPLGAVAMTATATQAQMKLPQIDTGHTSVHFTVWHGGVSPTIYQLRNIQKVDLQFDPKNPEKSKLSMTIEAASLFSNHYFRDTWARSAAELNVWKFPTISFVSTKVEKTGENTGKITGNLTLHGVTKEITADITRRVVKHFGGKWNVHGFVARGTFNRADFGLKAFTPWIGDKIDFTVIIEQRRALDE